MKSAELQHQQVLVYGDSLSWGIIPNTRRRLPFPQRWPGVMERELSNEGPAVRVIEDCLNGRRTVWDDPFKAGRNGLVGLEQRIEVNSPLALVILMLGTNDFQSVHQYNSWQSAQGVAALVRAIRRAPIEPEMPVPAILIVAPPRTGTPLATMAEKFHGAEAKSQGLSEALRAVSLECGCQFFDASSLISVSSIDGVHLDAAEHETLGRGIAVLVRTLLGES
jgi:lysophospholipase L1-like esterase